MKKDSLKRSIRLGHKPRCSQRSARYSTITVLGLILALAEIARAIVKDGFRTLVSLATIWKELVVSEHDLWKDLSRSICSVVTTLRK